jgi:hypothetical protein
MKLNHFPGQLTRWRNMCFASILCLCLLLASCGRPDQPISGAPVPSPTDSPTTPTSPTPTLTGPELDATKMAPEEERQRELATVQAGGTLPTPVGTLEPEIAAENTAIAAGQFPIPKPPRPPMLGIHGECADPDREFDYGGCWTGQGDGQYVFAKTGANGACAPRRRRCR